MIGLLISLWRRVSRWFRSSEALDDCKTIAAVEAAARKEGEARGALAANAGELIAAITKTVDADTSQRLSKEPTRGEVGATLARIKARRGS